jgi:hypothetical protein
MKSCDVNVLQRFFLQQSVPINEWSFKDMQQKKLVNESRY